MSRKEIVYVALAAGAVWAYYHYRTAPGVSGDAALNQQAMSAPPVLSSAGVALPQGTFGPSAPTAAQDAYDNLVLGVN